MQANVSAQIFISGQNHQKIVYSLNYFFFKVTIKGMVNGTALKYVNVSNYLVVLITTDDRRVKGDNCRITTAIAPHHKWKNILTKQYTFIQWRTVSILVALVVKKAFVRNRSRGLKYKSI